ncbi:MAG: sulfite exporter TauE/SafE family protein [Gammaproteobacteria bacterium]
MIAAVAALYSSVGHGGASGYIAVLGIAGLSRETVSSTALTMNLLVAGIALFAYARQGYFKWRTVWPFLLTSIPAAFVGGRFRLEEATYFLVLAAVLLFAAIQLIMRKKEGTEEQRQIPLVPALAFGVVIGLLSGVVGVGGGIFLSPLIILLGWAGAKETAAASALFILVNSGAGILGRVSTEQYEPVYLLALLGAGLIGALLGASVGAARLKPLAVQRVLAAVLFIAAMKMVYQYGY